MWQQIRQLYTRIFGKSVLLLVSPLTLITFAMTGVYAVLHETVRFQYDFGIEYVNMITGIFVIVIQQYNTYQIDLYNQIVFGFKQYLRCITSFTRELLSKANFEPLLTNHEYDKVAINKKFNVQNDTDRVKILQTSLALIQGITKELPTVGLNTLNRHEVIVESIKRPILFKDQLNELLYTIQQHLNTMELLGGVNGQHVNHINDELNSIAQYYIDVEKVSYNYPAIFFTEIIYTTVIGYLFMVFVIFYNKYGWLSIFADLMTSIMVLGLSLSSTAINDSFVNHRSENGKLTKECVDEVDYFFKNHK